MHIGSTPTSIDRILMEHGSFFCGGGSGLEHSWDEGQSPQEQPSEVSAHE